MWNLLISTAEKCYYSAQGEKFFIEKFARIFELSRGCGWLQEGRHGAGHYWKRF